jgi:hypothetical protein
MGKRQRPARFVLFYSNGKFFVAKKSKNTKLYVYEMMEHFVSFHSTEQMALMCAISRQKHKIVWEEEHLKHLKRRLRQVNKNQEETK